MHRFKINTIRGTMGRYHCNYKMKDVTEIHMQVGILYKKLINAFQRLHQQVGDYRKLRCQPFVIM